MNQDIYFPMKSNIDFFEKKSNQPLLINKIKQSLLMYENLYFDVGAYTLSCGDNGAFSNYFPPEQIHELDLDVPESTRTGFYVAMQLEPNGQPFCPIPPSNNSKSYTVCFQKLVVELGLQNEEFIKLGTFILPESGQKELKDEIWKNGDYKKYIEGIGFCKNNVFENFLESLVLSKYSGIPIMIDNLHDQLMSKLSYNSIKYDLRLEALNTMLKKINDRLVHLNTPDFSSMPIDELLDLRKDKEFRTFRTKILEINNALKERNIDKLKELVMDELISELGLQLQEMAPSREKIMLKVGVGALGMIPGVSEAISAANLVYDTAEEAKKLHQYENSWLAFIFQYQG